MADKLDKIALQVINESCVRTQTYLDSALHYLDVIEVSDRSRELSLARTKIDEAKLWLRKYNEGVMDKLSDKHDETGGE